MNDSRILPFGLVTIGSAMLAGWMATSTPNEAVLGVFFMALVLSVLGFCGMVLSALGFWERFADGLLARHQRKKEENNQKREQKKKNAPNQTIKIPPLDPKEQDERHI